MCAWVDTWGRAPLLVCVAAGLLLGDLTAGQRIAVPLSLLAVGGGASVMLLASLSPPLTRAAILVLACVVGYRDAWSVYHPEFPGDHVALAPTRTPLLLEGVLSADAEASGTRVRLVLAAERLDDGAGWRPTRGQVSVTLGEAQHLWSAGERIRAPLSLRHPRNYGNPGEFDYEGYLARRDIYVTAFAEDDAEFVRVGRVETVGTAWMARWRRGVGVLFHRVLRPTQAAVLSALIVGTQGELSRPLRTAFSRAGVSHVLSISGLHVGLVAAAGYAVCRWLLARSRWLLLSANVPKLAAALSLVPVFLYAGIAGNNVATTRSVIMILVFLVAVVVERQRHMTVCLAVAVTAILVSSPGAASDISFQLSFMAVLGLVLAMERFWPWWRAWEDARLQRLRGWRGKTWRTLAASVAVSLSALAATTPLTALHFNQVSLVAPLANALVVPLLGSVAVVLGLLAALSYWFSEPLAVVCTVVAGPFVQLGVWSVEWLAAVPYAAIRVVTPTAAELAITYAGLLAWVRSSGDTRVYGLALVAILGLIDAGWWYLQRYHRPDLRVTFLSIGEGDSAVVEFPGAAVMVIDGGGVGGDAFDVGERIIAPFLWSRKVAHLDYLVLSHPDWDHFGGLTFLAQQFSPQEFWWNGSGSSAERFFDLRRALAAHDVRSVRMQRGVHRRIGGVDASVASPPFPPDGLTSNDQSLVLSLAFGRPRVLFTGDIEAPTEERLLAAGDGELASVVLKAPHHGSHTSSTPGFLDAVAPQVVVVSAGFENRFGFPHPDVLRRYAARHFLVARTDLDGAVQVRIDAHGGVTLRRYRDRSPTQVGVDSPVRED